jgi:hypothetical protein
MLLKSTYLRWFLGQGHIRCCEETKKKETVSFTRYSRKSIAFLDSLGKKIHERMKVEKPSIKMTLHINLNSCTSQLAPGSMDGSLQMYIL